MGKAIAFIIYSSIYLRLDADLIQNTDKSISSTCFFGIEKSRSYRAIAI